MGEPAPAAARGATRRSEITTAAEGLAEAAEAEARAVGARMRCIHRLWSAAQEARTEARFESLARAEADLAAGLPPRPDPLGPLREPERRLLLDVAAEVGPALHLPAGTAVRRVEDAVLLAETLPHVLEALEAGRIGPRQAEVLVEQWRELVVEAPSGVHAGSAPPPVDAVYRLVGELLERAPHATAAQLRAVARRRRAVLVTGAEETARRAARKRRCVWVEPAGEGTAYLHALLDAPVALAVRDRLDEPVARLRDRAPRPGDELLHDAAAEPRGRDPHRPPGGVGRARNPQVFLKSGDVVEVEIDGLGTLTNKIVDTPEAAWGHEVRTAQGRTVPATGTVWMRAFEVWIHAVELDNRARFADVPAGVLARLLGDVVGNRAAEDAGPGLRIQVSDAPQLGELGAGAGRYSATLVRGDLATVTQWAAGRGGQHLQAGADVANPRRIRAGPAPRRPRQSAAGACGVGGP